jgi:hypothetical protein
VYGLSTVREGLLIFLGAIPEVVLFVGGLGKPEQLWPVYSLRSRRLLPWATGF